MYRMIVTYGGVTSVNKRLRSLRDRDSLRTRFDPGESTVPWELEDFLFDPDFAINCDAISGDSLAIN